MNRKFPTLPALVALAILCAAVINIFLIINAYIPSDSMEPTVDSGSFLIGDRNAYEGCEPQNGDIIFFENTEVSDSLLVKRIIATPGQKFSMKKGQVYIDGSPLHEPYVENPSNDDFEEITVPENSYVVLGDNRTHSNDSRFWKNPFISKEQIKAKANLIWFPKFKIIDTE